MPRLDKTGSPRVTMSDVANLAQCSQSTVSVVLNPGSTVRISQDTRDRILRAARQLGYKLERSPSPRAGRPMRRIAVVFDDLTICPEAVIAVDGVREFYWETGDIVSAYNCHADAAMEARTLEAILRGSPSAIIYTTVRTREVTVPRALYDTDAPVVLLNCYTRDRAFPAVVPGDVAAANRATELLVAAGHTRIAHITGEAWQEVSADRLRGYRDALATADLPFDPTLVLEGNWQLSSGYTATLELMQGRRPPTAIFCANDRMAIGCYEALKQLGLRIPDDVSVVGFDDEDLASHIMPKLTTLKFPRRQMGVWAAERALAPDHSRAGNHRIVKLECDLVERESVGPARVTAAAGRTAREAVA
jgi:LacI family transcriptional regulator